MKWWETGSRQRDTQEPGAAKSYRACVCVSVCLCVCVCVQPLPEEQNSTGGAGFDWHPVGKQVTMSSEPGQVRVQGSRAGTAGAGGCPAELWGQEGARQSCASPEQVWMCPWEWVCAVPWLSRAGSPGAVLPAKPCPVASSAIPEGRWRVSLKVLGRAGGRAMEAGGSWRVSACGVVWVDVGPHPTPAVLPGKRTKKGMATAKQRLGKILKIHRNGKLLL